MSESPSPTSSYTMGYSDEFQQLLDRRSADTHAFYLLPHLKSGQRVLDFGCGPGTITMGLARPSNPARYTASTPRHPRSTWRGGCRRAATPTPPSMWAM